jgi:hypothetical protein
MKRDWRANKTAPAAEMQHRLLRDVRAGARDLAQNHHCACAEDTLAPIDGRAGKYSFEALSCRVDDFAEKFA